MEDPKSAKNEKTSPLMGGASYRDLMKRSSVINMSKSTTMQHASEMMAAVFNVPPQEYRRTPKSDLEIARSFGSNQTPNPYANMEFEQICNELWGGLNRVSMAIAQNDKRERTASEDVERARKLAYAALKGVMSPASHYKCMLKQNYRDNEDVSKPGHFNPDILAKVMFDVHVTDQGGSTAADSQNYLTKLEDEWKAVQMLDNEQVYEYVHRYNFARDACITAGGRGMNAMADTMQFIKGLNGKYGGLKLLYSNRSRPWPETVQYAYMEADEFKDLEPIHASSKHQQAGQSAAHMARTFAFQAKLDRTAGSDREYTPAQTARYQRRQAVMKIKATALAGQPEGTPFCARCGKTGHGAHDCRTEHKLVDAFDEKITDMAGVAKPQGWTGKPADVKRNGGRTAKFTQDTKVMVIGKKPAGIKNFEAEWSDDEDEVSEGEAYDDMIADNSYCGVIRDRGQDEAYSPPGYKQTTGRPSKQTPQAYDTAAAGYVSVRGAMSSHRARAADSVAAGHITAAAVDSAKSATTNDSEECPYKLTDSDTDDEWEWPTSQMGRGDPSSGVETSLNTATAAANDDRHTSYVIMHDYQHTNNEQTVTPPYQTYTIPGWAASLVLLVVMFMGVLMPPGGDATRTPRGGVSHAIASGIPGAKLQPWRHIAERLEGTSGIQGALDALQEGIDARTLATGYDEAFGPLSVLWDCQAGVNICRNEDLGRNFKKCRPCRVGGVEKTSEGILVTQTCNMLDDKFGRMSFTPEAVANIISQGNAIDCGFEVDFDKKRDTFTVQHSSGGRTYKFGRQIQVCGQKSKHYAMDITTLLPLHDLPFARICCTGPDTVAANEARFTKRQVADAKMAVRFLDVMGGQTLEMSIESCNGMTNAPVTESDIRRAIAINPQLRRLKGSTTKHKSASPDKDVPVIHEPEPQIMEVDIMFLKGQMFLVALLCPLDLCMARPLLGGKGADELRDAIKVFHAAAKARGFPVIEMRCDNEAGIRDQDTLTYLHSQGLPVEFVGAGAHCARVERRIRWVKEKFRGIEHTLPYVMNTALIRGCVLASARFTNMQRTASSTTATTPRDKFLRRRFDYKLDGTIVFGELLEVTVTDPDNTSRQRTETCIALMPRDNHTGTIHAYSLKSRLPVVRDHFARRPMTEAVIKLLNKSAAAQGHTRDDTPIQDAAEVAEDKGPDAAGGEADDSNAAAAAQPPRPATRSQGAALEGDGVDPLPDTGVWETEVNEHDENAERIGVHDAEGAGVHDAEGAGVHDTWDPEPAYWSDAMTVTQRSTAAANLKRPSRARATVLAIRKGVNFSDGDFELSLLRQYKRTSGWKDKQYAFTISVKAAMRDYPESGTATIEKELQQMLSKEVFHAVHASGLSHAQLRSIIPCKLFVKERLDPDGVFEKLKGRLVAGGHRQDKSLYEDLSSPTAEQSSVMTVAAIAASEGRHVATCDIAGAYLNAPMSPTGVIVHMRIDSTLAAILAKLDPSYAPYLNKKGEVIVALDKALYGCVESASLWYAQLSTFLTTELDFTANIHDPCVFNMIDGHGKQVTIVLHVDDMFLTCETQDTIRLVLAAIDERYPETTMSFGPKIAFLAMSMDFTCKGECEVTMNGMVDDILHKCGLDDDAVASSPALANLFEVDTDKLPVDSVTDQEWFHSHVAKILYLAKRVKPECLTTVSYLATRVNKADADDFGKLRRLLRYLRGSRGRGLRLCPGERGVCVRAYIDAAYGVHVDGKSHSGSALMIGDNALVHVRSGKQSIIVKSSTEAEFVSTSDNMNMAFHTRNFIIAQGHSDSPVEILQDNLSCMVLLHKNRSTSLRTKHIQIRYYWICERIDGGEAYVTHMKTEMMGAANILTKPLSGKQFLAERQALTNWDKDV